MKKAAARDNKTTTAEDTVQQYLDGINAKRQFLGTTLNMSWRLALTVLIPVIGGVKLDDHFHTSPSWTLTGFIVAAVGACSAVWGTIQELNADQKKIDQDVPKENKE
ncbi:MAG: hypothetical protein NVSMB46_05570 [Candidatus Saccharimonadales bacterium]